MNCPLCGVKLICGCDSCKINFPKKENEYYLFFLEDGETQKCTNCGFYQHADNWLDEEVLQLKQVK